MEQALATKSQLNATTMENVLIGGNLSSLQPAERMNYYQAVCNSLGLNPLTKPFDYINLSGKLVLYAKRDATDQLRKINGVSVTRLEREKIEGIYVVTAYATEKTGRQDSSIGAVNIEGLKGDSLANAMMKAETKAKRRVTLSICGLGLLDETEVETIPDAVVVHPVDPAPANGNGNHADPHPEPSTGAPMPMERALTIENSEGVLYRNLASNTLVHMANTIGKKPSLTPEQSDKLLAIQVILKDRAGLNPVSLPQAVAQA